MKHNHCGRKQKTLPKEKFDDTSTCCTPATFLKNNESNDGFDQFT